MKKKHIGWLFLLSLMVFSCAKPKPGPTDNLVLKGQFKGDLIAGDYFEKVDYVFLDGGDDAFFVDIKDLDFCDGKWFILDHRIKRVLCFAEDGQHEFTIDAVGKGPGEYTLPESMIIQKQLKQIWLEDRMTRRILKYDFNGKFIGEDKYERMGFDLAGFSDGQVLVFSQFWHKFSENDSVGPGLYFLEKRFKERKMLIKHDKRFQMTDWTSEYVFGMNKDTCFYLDHTDTLKAITPDRQLHIAGIFDFGKYHLPAHLTYLKSGEQNFIDISTSGKVVSKEKLVPTDDWFFFQVGLNKALWYAIANRHTGQVKISQNFINDLSYGPFIFPMAKKSDDELVGFLHADYLLAMQESLQKMNPDKNAEAVEAMLEIAEKALEKTGNVLVVMKLKTKNT